MSPFSMEEYKFLIEAEQQAQVDYEKTILSLSGGALGVSFAFVKDIVGGGAMVNKFLILSAWIIWGISITMALASFYTRQQALRKAQIQDNRKMGNYSHATAILHILAGVLFLSGVLLIVLFAFYNF